MPPTSRRQLLHENIAVSFSYRLAGKGEQKAKNSTSQCNIRVRELIPTDSVLEIGKPSTSLLNSKRPLRQPTGSVKIRRAASNTDPCLSSKEQFP